MITGYTIIFSFVCIMLFWKFSHFREQILCVSMTVIFVEAGIHYEHFHGHTHLQTLAKLIHSQVTSVTSEWISLAGVWKIYVPHVQFPADQPIDGKTKCTFCYWYISHKLWHLTPGVIWSFYVPWQESCSLDPLVMEVCRCLDLCCTTIFLKWCQGEPPQKNNTKQNGHTGQVLVSSNDRKRKYKCFLTNWGWVTHMCVGKLTIIGSDNGLSPGWCQAIIWPNAGKLLIGPLRTNFSEILIRIQTFSSRKMHLKMLSAKWHPFLLGLNVLNKIQHVMSWYILLDYNNRAISQIPECTCSRSQNALFTTEMCTLLFWMEHCGIWNRSILRFVNWVNSLKGYPLT